MSSGADGILVTTQPTRRLIPAVFSLRNAKANSPRTGCYHFATQLPDTGRDGEGLCGSDRRERPNKQGLLGTIRNKNVHVEANYKTARRNRRCREPNNRMNDEPGRSFSRRTPEALRYPVCVVYPSIAVHILRNTSILNIPICTP